MSSSSTTLWATASKEWVIQPKPRPGRKPKTDLAVSSSANGSSEVEPKARRVQNRAAQRAFRERKQSQLAELQARVQSYEQGEMDKSVALQRIAKHLKEENDKLRQENSALQTKLAQLEHVNQQLPPTETDKKRWREDSPSSAPHSQLPPRKKSRADSSTYPCLPAFSQTYLPSPPSLVSTPDSNEAANSHFSALSCDSHVDLNSPLFSHPDGLKESDVNIHPLPPFSCGFCDEGTLCVCRDIVTSQVVDGNVGSSPEVQLDAANSSQPRLLMRHDTSVANMKMSTNGSLSILDNLPEYQPPVPLKRRSGGTSINSVFYVQPASTSQTRSGISDATCSGDPSNCTICADDSFGKAFCTAVATSACIGCDGFSDQFGSGTENCCKNGSKCGHPCPSGSSPTLDPAAASSSSEFIPTNDAWQKLKAHPNVDFADLSLLAEVVASRTKCSGPQLVISSTPPTQIRGERTSAADRHGGDSPIRLVDEAYLLECGRRRVRQVHSDGVREALRMLDAKFC
ncbi:hypothetical protein BYT27DRAFT_7138477 [Phlegmacium glaucopus]|nr:hypothetical protein BYT27DRAFT_7138477 [Phlegmacium glaucopus]